LPFPDSKLYSILGDRAALTLALSRRERGRFSEADGEKPEHITDFTGKTGFFQRSAAESGAGGAENRPLDPDLAVVVQAWPDVPETVRASILAMVRAAAGDQ
jgi:hypothetical protein